MGCGDGGMIDHTRSQLYDFQRLDTPDSRLTFLAPKHFDHSLPFRPAPDDISDPQSHPLADRFEPWVCVSGFAFGVQQGGCLNGGIR